LKKKAKPLLMDKWTITITHKVVTFLHPKYKGLKFKNGAEKEKVKAEERRLISIKCLLQDKEDENATQPPTKKKKPIMGNLDEFENSSGDEASSAATGMMITMDEVFKYGCEKIHSTETSDLLPWWCQHEKEFPHLTKLAYFIPAIPALSVPSERSFSTAGHMMQDRHTSLKPKAVDGIIFLNSNLPK
jgi:hypothetical protein